MLGRAREAIGPGTERGAAWLAHQSGGLGVASSNLAAPTKNSNESLDNSASERRDAESNNGTDQSQTAHTSPETPEIIPNRIRTVFSRRKTATAAGAVENGGHGLALVAEGCGQLTGGAVSGAARVLLRSLESRLNRVDERQADWNERRMCRQSPRSAEEIEEGKRRFRAKRECRSPDRKASRDRRRQLGGDGKLPPELRLRYTEAERAVHSIVTGEVRRRGFCDLCNDQIAALAGCSLSSVHNALRAAVDHGDIQITRRPRRGQKNDTNIIHVISSEWLVWIKFQRRSIEGSTGYKIKNFYPTKIEDKEKGCGKESRTYEGGMCPTGRRAREG